MAVCLDIVEGSRVGGCRLEEVSSSAFSSQCMKQQIGCGLWVLDVARQAYGSQMQYAGIPHSRRDLVHYVF